MGKTPDFGRGGHPWGKFRDYYLYLLHATHGVPPPHPWDLQILVDPVTCRVEENPWIGWRILERGWVKSTGRWDRGLIKEDEINTEGLTYYCILIRWFRFFFARWASPAFVFVACMRNNIIIYHKSRHTYVAHSTNRLKKNTVFRPPCLNQASDSMPGVNGPSIFVAAWKGWKI